ncbi:MAG TPA: hypothetical protein VGC13_05345 [Longimicrobium sp.]|jgi:hypothetical protein|uniref:hypothetical protein n=1 Tax=Longimicrobium sp. TaxID=2029185 RepID=UPI002ED82033
MSTVPSLEGGTGVPPTLWRDEAGGRFYLVPDGADIGAGALLLRSGATRVLHADPAAVAAYEVSREEGRAFLDAKLDAFAGGTQSRVESWLDRVAPLRHPQGGEAGTAGAADARDPMRNAGSAGDAEDAVSAEPLAAPQHGPGVKLFASLTGQAEERVAGSPEALLRGLGRLFESAAEAVAEARTGEEGREAVRARLRALGDQLRAHGISVPPPEPGKTTPS